MVIIYLCQIYRLKETNVLVHPLHLMDTSVIVQEQPTMVTTSIITATVDILEVVASTEDVRLVLPGQGVPHCV